MHFKHVVWSFWGSSYRCILNTSCGPFGEVVRCILNTSCGPFGEAVTGAV